jgi:hypothetical protein
LFAGQPLSFFIDFFQGWHLAGFGLFYPEIVHALSIEKATEKSVAFSIFSGSYQNYLVFPLSLQSASGRQVAEALSRVVDSGKDSGKTK